MAAGETTTRRRKIFPHLEESDGKKKADNDNIGNKDATKSKDGASNNNNAEYDNAKSSKKKKQHPSAVKKSTKSTTNSDDDVIPNEEAGTSLHHLVPLPLVFTVLICSGLFWISSFRDVMATGKPILDTLGVLWGQDDADIHFLVSRKYCELFVCIGFS